MIMEDPESEYFDSGLQDRTIFSYLKFPDVISVVKIRQWLRITYFISRNSGV